LRGPSASSSATLLGKAGRGLDLWRRSGTSAVVRTVADRLVNRVVRATLIDVVVLEASPRAGGPAPPAGYEMRFLRADEIRRFAADPAHDLRRDFVESAAAHHACFAALAGDQLAAYGWYALGAIGAEHTFGVALAYPDDVAYMYKGFTHPDHRGARLHGTLMLRALRHLADRGIARLVSLVDWTNAASLRSCQRIGYVRLGRVWLLQLPAHQLLLVPRRATALGLRFGAAAPARPPRAIARGRAA
jgi:ribosomal protein S18 acetylase RimI-like enzyme